MEGGDDKVLIMGEGLEGDTSLSCFSLSFQKFLIDSTWVLKDEDLIVLYALVVVLLVTLLLLLILLSLSLASISECISEYVKVPVTVPIPIPIRISITAMI